MELNLRLGFLPGNGYERTFKLLDETLALTYSLRKSLGFSKSTHRKQLTVYCSLLTEMIFAETKLKGAYIIDIEKIEDERGFFARSFCKKEFEAHGLNSQLVQCNISFNKKKGTLRGMHYQVAPYEEAKLVRCTRGSIYDVIIDLRPGSITYCQWIGVELSSPRFHLPSSTSPFPVDSSPLTAHRLLTADDSSQPIAQGSPPAAHSSPLTAHGYMMLYIPQGFAHGFLTLEDDTEVFYQMSEFYAPDFAHGVRWNDPAFGIEWPIEVKVISDRDRSYPDFSPLRNG